MRQPCLEIAETNLRLKSIIVAVDRIQKEKNEVTKKLAAALTEIERLKSRMAIESPQQLKTRIKIKKIMRIFLCNKPLEVLAELETLCSKSKEKILLIYDAIIKPHMDEKYDSSMSGNVFFRRSWKKFDRDHEWRNCAIFLYLFNLTLKNSVYKFKLHSYLPKRIEYALIRAICLYEGISKDSKTQAEDLLYTDPLHPCILEVMKFIRKNGFTIVSKLDCEVISDLENILDGNPELPLEEFRKLFSRLSELMRGLVRNRARKIHEALIPPDGFDVDEVTALYFKEVIEALQLEFKSDGIEFRGVFRCVVT